MYKRIFISLILISVIFTSQIFCSHSTPSLFEAMEHFEKGDYQKAARGFAPYAGQPCPVAEPYCIDLLKKNLLGTFQIVPSNEEYKEKDNLKQWYEAQQKLKALLRQKNKNFDSKLKAVMSSSNGPLLYLLGKLYETGTQKIDADQSKAANYFLLAFQKGDPRGILGLNRICPESEIIFGETPIKISRLASLLSLMGTSTKSDGEILAGISAWYSKDPVVKQYFLRAAAQFGHTKSQFEYGQSYSSNEAEVLFWMMQAAENNQREAIGVCGHFFEQGKGTKQDYLKAYHYFKRAAYHPQATSLDYFNFALIHEQGKGVLEDYETALTWYKRAFKADPTNKLAEYRYGRILGLLGNYSKAVKYLRQTRDHSVERAYNYAYALLKEQGEDKIPSEALKIFEKLIDQAHLEAITVITQYAYNNKIVFDLNKLKQMLKVLIKQEENVEKRSIAYQCLYMIACKEMGCTYTTNLKAISFLENALKANRSNYEVKFLYARYLKDSRKFKRALKYLREVEQSGTKVVFNEIGACYALLALEQADFEASLSMEKEAYGYYLKHMAFPENEDYPTAAYNIACLHIKGRAGLKEDSAEILKYLHIAAEGKDLDALNDLAVAYHLGLYGAERDLEKAKCFYKQGIQEGGTISKLNYALLLLCEGQSEEAYSESKDLFKEVLPLARELIHKIFSTIGNIKNQEIIENTENLESCIVEPVQTEVEIIEELKVPARSSQAKPTRMYNPLKQQKDEEQDEDQKFNKKFDRLKQKLNKFKGQKQAKYRKVKALMEQFIQLEGGHLKKGKGSGQRVRIGDNFSGFHRPHTADLKKGALKGITRSMEVASKKGC
ncbi:MAG: sel1 repeat family protein [Alphaproteobacteria bacterium]|nr:sel1 repeat family protein [Alphaproteobacteria bacterium]